MCKTFPIITALFFVSCIKSSHESSCSQEILASPCIDYSQIDSGVICTQEYVPVCGCDKVTYNNACSAEAAGVQAYVDGECCE